MPFGIGMPGWKWRGGWAARVVEPANQESIKNRAREVLARAAKGTPWTSRCGVKHIPLIVDGTKVGELWEDIDPKSVEIGAYRIGRWGIKVQLIHNGRVVGFIWIPQA